MLAIDERTGCRQVRKLHVHVLVLHLQMAPQVLVEIRPRVDEELPYQPLCCESSPFSAKM